MLEGNIMSAKRTGRRVVSANMLDAMRTLAVTEEPEDIDPVSDGEECVDDEDLPDWAKRITFADDPIGVLCHPVVISILY